AGEVDEYVAFVVRRGGDRARARSGCCRLPRAALPRASGHLARSIDVNDLDVRPVGKARMRLEQRADELDIGGIADDDRVRIADVHDRDVEAGDALARDDLRLAEAGLVLIALAPD